MNFKSRKREWAARRSRRGVLAWGKAYTRRARWPILARFTAWVTRLGGTCNPLVGRGLAREAWRGVPWFDHGITALRSSAIRAAGTRLSAPGAYWSGIGCGRGWEVASRQPPRPRDQRRACRPGIWLRSLLTLAILSMAPAASAAGLRIATFNVSLYGRHAGEVLARLQSGADAQSQHLAEIVQRVRPDVLVLNEIDYDADGAVLAAFCEKYLAVGQNVSGSEGGPSAPIEFPHRMAFATNTGEHSGLDLDRNGRVNANAGTPSYGGDCWGYGIYPGQYAFAVLSKYPIDAAAIRQFRKFLWKDMPGALLPDDAATEAAGDWYSTEILSRFRLSSKNHCDVPIDVDGKRIHLLLSHPTPPVFDATEDRHGRRNQDELRLWADYIGAADAAAYIYDDGGVRGGLAAGESFVIVGDLNGDPHDGEGSAGISDLLASPRLLKYSFPTSQGAVEATRVQGRVNKKHQGNPAEDTEDAADVGGPGNLHLDYILPSSDLNVRASGVFWPTAEDPLAALVAGAEQPASPDHRLVWVDLER